MSQHSRSTTGMMRQMLREARLRHHRVRPCSHKRTFRECLTNDNGYLLLWYNTDNDRTHVVLRKTG